MSRSIQQAQKGFTLMELMIVVAIIGILASVALPAYQDYVARAQMSEALTLASGPKVAISEVFAQNGSCPVNGSDGIAPAADIKGKYVDSVTTGGAAATGGGCTIVALISSSTASKGIQGKTLTLALSNADKGSNVWTCTTSAAQKYAPKACTSTAT
ncbi:pilin [Xylophilus ampelinus]|nr:pilin [Xylophilus ampelinus]